MNTGAALSTAAHCESSTSGSRSARRSLSETTDEVIRVFKTLAEQGFTADDIVFYGDSAGGGLAAAATRKMRDLGMEMPAALVLWSPWADISETGAVSG